MWVIASTPESNHNEGLHPFSAQGALMRKKRLIAVAAALALSGGMVMAAPASANTGGNTEGCTPGFWKNHTDWKSYDDNASETADDNSPETTLSVMLRSPDGNGAPYTFPTVYGDLGEVTMLAALSQGGGSSLRGAANNLMRHAVAAYLNADAGIDYPYRRYTQGVNGEAPLVVLIQDALNSEERREILSLKNDLAAANELGCPLS
jgi:hypothetical protein